MSNQPTLFESLPYKTHDGRKCKYCNNYAAKSLTKEGIDKGYRITCGSEICITKVKTVKALNISKNNFTLRVCNHCKETYSTTSSNQKYCTICCPSHFYRRIMQKYNLSFNEYHYLLELHDGKCHVCQTKVAQVIDHDHNTGLVRGVLCKWCNTLLGMIDKEDIRMRAIEYLEKTHCVFPIPGKKGNPRKAKAK